jgi:hypothetical protein
MPSAVAGHRVGWNRSAGMLYAEGHPSCAMPGEWSVVTLIASEEDRTVEQREPWLVLIFRWRTRVLWRLWRLLGFLCLRLSGRLVRRLMTCCRGLRSAWFWWFASV